MIAATVGFGISESAPKQAESLRATGAMSAMDMPAISLTSAPAANTFSPP